TRRSARDPHHALMPKSDRLGIARDPRMATKLLSCLLIGGAAAVAKRLEDDVRLVELLLVKRVIEDLDPSFAREKKSGRGVETERDLLLGRGGFGLHAR